MLLENPRYPRVIAVPPRRSLPTLTPENLIKFSDLYNQTFFQLISPLQQSSPYGISLIMETQSAIPGASVTQLDVPDPLPHWMRDPQQPCPDDPVPRQTHLLKHATYANLFESSLERIMGGTPLQTIIRNDPRGIQLGRFLFWINRDPTRKQRYEEACSIAAEAMAHELTAIADALDLDNEPVMEDVQRSALRMKSRTYLMEKWSPQRYGDSKRIQIDSTSLNANISADDLAKLSLPELKAMAARVFARNAERDDTIDVTPDDPLDEAK